MGDNPITWAVGRCVDSTVLHTSYKIGPVGLYMHEKTAWKNSTILSNIDSSCFICWKFINRQWRILNRASSHHNNGRGARTSPLCKNRLTYLGWCSHSYPNCYRIWSVSFQRETTLVHELEWSFKKLKTKKNRNKHQCVGPWRCSSIAQLVVEVCSFIFLEQFR